MNAKESRSGLRWSAALLALQLAGQLGRPFPNIVGQIDPARRQPDIVEVRLLLRTAKPDDQFEPDHGSQPCLVLLQGSRQRGQLGWLQCKQWC